MRSSIADAAFFSVRQALALDRHDCVLLNCSRVMHKGWMALERVVALSKEVQVVVPEPWLRKFLGCMSMFSIIGSTSGEVGPYVA